MAEIAASSKSEVICVDSATTADAVLGRMASETATLKEREAKLNRAIEALRNRFGPELQELRAGIEAKRIALFEWAKLNRAEFGEKKSLELLHGTIGFRLGNKFLDTLSKFAWKKVLAAMKGKRWLPYVRIKREPDKVKLLADALRAENPLPAATLSKIGLKIEQEENFFVELKQL